MGWEKKFGRERTFIKGQGPLISVAPPFHVSKGKYLFCIKLLLEGEKRFPISSQHQDSG